MAKKTQQIVARNGLTVSFELITPEIAKTLLDVNKINRKMSNSSISQMIRDIENDKFDTTHQGIAFFTNGLLADGQHRLVAIARANKAVELLVSTNLPLTTNIDQGRKRSHGDNLRMKGVSVSNTTITWIRAMFAGFRIKTEFTSSEIEALVSKYQDSTLILQQLCKTSQKGLQAASVWGAGLLALNNGVDIETLGQFYSVLQSGITTNNKTDIRIIKLRDWLISTNLTGGVNRQICSQKVQKCIAEYVADKTNCELTAASGNIYTLPEMNNA